MILREYEPEDWDQIVELYKAQGFAYRLPEANKFIESLVVEHDGHIVMAIFARPTVETYMFADNDFETPGMRKEVFAQLHEAMRKRLLDRNYQDAHAFLPPKIAKKWGRRLTKYFGWVYSTWPCYVGFTER